MGYIIYKKKIWLVLQENNGSYFIERLLELSEKEYQFRNSWF